MQDFSSLDTSRNATAVAPARGIRGFAQRVRAYYLGPGVSGPTRVKRVVWTAVVALAVVVLAQHAFPRRPDVVYGPPTALPPPSFVPVAPVQQPLPPDTAKMFTQEQLDQKRDAWLKGTQEMAADAEKRAPGTVGAYQARSFADFLAAHCGKPGGCLKK